MKIHCIFCTLNILICSIYGSEGSIFKPHTAAACRPPSPPKAVLLDTYQEARATANTLITALAHARTTHDFKEITSQFQKTITILTQPAQKELIQQFGNAKIARERDLRTQTIRARQLKLEHDAQLKREKYERERAARAASQLRTSPKTIVKPAPVVLIAQSNI